MAINVREEVLALVGQVEEPHRDGGKLRPGDVPVGVEAAVLIAVQNARVGHGGDGVVVPGVRRHVGEVVALAPVLVPALVGEHPEEDGGHLGPGDLPLGLHRLSGLVVGGLARLIVHGVAHDVAVVVFGVQAGLVAAASTAAAAVGNLVPNQHKGRELLRRKLQILFPVQGDDLQPAIGGSVRLYFVPLLANQALRFFVILPVQPGEMDKLKVIVAVRALGQFPVDIHRPIRGDPGPAVGLIHQVQILIDVVVVGLRLVILHQIVLQNLLAFIGRIAFCGIPLGQLIRQQVNILCLHCDMGVVDHVLGVRIRNRCDGTARCLINGFCVFRHVIGCGGNLRCHLPIGGAADCEGPIAHLNG